VFCVKVDIKINNITGSFWKISKVDPKGFHLLQGFPEGPYSAKGDTTRLSFAISNPQSGTSKIGPTFSVGCILTMRKSVVEEGSNGRAGFFRQEDGNFSRCPVELSGLP